LAIYHFSIDIISRGKGKSAVAASAYRAGEKLLNEWDGELHDYTQKRGVEVFIPERTKEHEYEIESFRKERQF